jgi:hypothetical protein
MVEAAPLDRVVEFARAVAGEDGDGRGPGAHRSDLGNTHLVLAQVFEQKGFERLVRAVHLVDQQHRAGLGRLQGQQQGAPDQVSVLVHLALHLVGLLLAFHGAHVQQLRGVVPFVQSFALFDPVVALQPQQLALQGLGQRLGQLGLADAGLALQQQRALQLQGQEDGRGQPAIGKVANSFQRPADGVDAGKRRAGGRGDHRGAIIPGPGPPPAASAH